MVLRHKILIFMMFLCFMNVYAHGIYLYIADVSEEARNDLEWTAYHVNMGTEDGTELLGYYDWWQSYSRNAFQEFTLYNNGTVPHTVKFGVSFEYSIFYSQPEEARQFLFEINGIPVQHQIVGGYEDELRKLYGYDLEACNYVFCEVVFPPNEGTTIKVYSHSGTIGKFFPNGIPQFTATIYNRRLDPDRPYFAVEDSWIRDISFARDSDWHGVDVEKSLMAILEREGSLANDFFVLQKMNENTLEIEFTSRLVEKNRNALRLEVGYGNWGLSEPMSMGWYFDIADAMTEYENIFLTNRQLRVLRNAVYARHGYVFKDEGMRNMFEEMREPYFGQIYYRTNPNFTEDMLTETDRANIATIQRLEALAVD